jgi:fatty acid desaturase
MIGAQVLTRAELPSAEASEFVGVTGARLPSPREVARMFPPEDGDECQTRAILWSIAGYVAFAAYAAGWLPVWLMVFLAVTIFFRHTNAQHETYHAPPIRSRLVRLGRWMFMMLPWPIFLGSAEVHRNHQVHHGKSGSPQDPDRYMLLGGWWRTLLHALFQPEQSVYFYVKREGLTLEFVLKQVMHVAIVAAMVWLGGLEKTLAWIGTMRLTNSVSWWAFTWGLHHERFWGRFTGIPAPWLVDFLWALFYGKHALYTVRYHYLHHTYPFVRARDLPLLSAALRNGTLKA